MKSKLIAPGNGSAQTRTHVVVLETGDEFVECLTGFAEQHGLTASQLTALGAFATVELGYFEWERKEYRRIPLDEQVEVVSLVGEIALKDGRANLHPHVTVARRDGSAWGGHLLKGIVRPILEVIVTESPAVLARHHDAETGLALLRIE